MTNSRSLPVHPHHLSQITCDVLTRRGARGSSFYRQGDLMFPMLGEYTLSVSVFRQIYERDHGRIEEAMPLDLLFLHQVALANGYDEIAIRPTAEPDQRLPWYGGSNQIQDLGDLLQGQEPRLSHRKTRHLDEAGRIEAIAPGQVRNGRLELRFDLVPAPEQDVEEDLAPGF